MSLIFPALRPVTDRARHGNTPGVIDPANPDAQQVYRGIGQVGANGKFSFTETSADPDKLVATTDDLAATTLPSGEAFPTLRTADAGDVCRGVSFTPGS